MPQIRSCASALYKPNNNFKLGQHYFKGHLAVMGNHSKLKVDQINLILSMDRIHAMVP